MDLDDKIRLMGTADEVDFLKAALGGLPDSVIEFEDDRHDSEYLLATVVREGDNRTIRIKQPFNGEWKGSVTFRLPDGATDVTPKCEVDERRWEHFYVHFKYDGVDYTFVIKEFEEE